MPSPDSRFHAPSGQGRLEGVPERGLIRPRRDRGHVATGTGPRIAAISRRARWPIGRRVRLAAAVNTAPMDELMATLDVHLAVQAVDVALDRMDGDVERALDLFVALAVDHELQDLHFARRQAAGLPDRGEIEPLAQNLAQAAGPGHEAGLQPEDGHGSR